MATVAEETERTVAVCMQLASLLEAKNTNYKRNLQRHGMQGIVIRMSDKMMRLENMILGDVPDAVGESFTDTLADIAGYAVRAIVLLSLGDLSRNGEWADKNGVLPGQMTVHDCIDNVIQFPTKHDRP